MRPNGARLIAACPRRSTRYCARLAGPSCPWMSQRIIIESLPSSDLSPWMVGNTDLRAQAVVSVTGSPSLDLRPFRVSRVPIPHKATAITRQGQTLEGDLEETGLTTRMFETRFYVHDPDAPSVR